MSWSSLISWLLLGLVVAAQPATSTDTAAAPSPLLKQSQNVFIQWVLSLLPQRPGSMPESLNATLATLTSSGSPLMSTTTTAEPFTTTPPPSSSSSTTTRRATTPAPPLTSNALNPPRNCSDCFCGIANIQKRIVGGQETEIHQYPWVAMLLYGGRFYCAASLLNDQFLLTASHCVYGFRRERISVRMLEHDRKLSHIQKIDRKVMEVITHPKYNARNYDNDIAILKLDEPVEFSELLHPVCMPTPGRSFKGETAIVTGWGALKVGGPTSDTLQEVQVPVMSQDECRKSRYGAARITDNMLCAGFVDKGGKDSCQGDSGGPLHIVANGTREHQIAGVVSWGEGCAKMGYPGVYARVNRYGTWIKNLTKQACLCQSETKKIKLSSAMRSVYLLSLLLLYVGWAQASPNVRSVSEPAKILETLSNLRQNSFLDWIVSILGPEYAAPELGVPAKRECTACACGGVNTRHRIVGGQETEVHEYPWMAMLMWFGSFYCGASLVNDQYAITAAHCVNGFYHRLITVRLLEHNRVNSSVKVVDRRVSRVLVHPDYSTRTFDSDIALIRFNEPVRLGIDMHPVCLPSSTETYAGQTAVVTGWGAISEGGPVSDTLQEVEVPILSQEQCRASNYGPQRISDNMICAGFVEQGGKDSCQGDSGGPMHVLDSAQSLNYQLAGIVSWGEGCAKPGSPGVYTRVSNFNEWIELNTRDSCGCGQVPQDNAVDSTSTQEPQEETTTAQSAL
ncbi:transmembrane protease serine 9-like [Scaptodrosophila lebanonensis]|uniref:Transmembrane protease serine 9-like n=1 Tax=Drosophila lebanonensis TaxID=7225 RepID=A0A6J2TKC4_DROLE|nr:transmembrane protease serine 9-like [Scaptodrosophila lebanonensis]